SQKLRPPPRSTLFPYTTLFRSIIGRLKSSLTGGIKPAMKQVRLLGRRQSRPSHNMLPPPRGHKFWIRRYVMTNLVPRDSFFQDLFDFRRDFDQIFNRMMSGWPFGGERTANTSTTFAPAVE